MAVPKRKIRHKCHDNNNGGNPLVSIVGIGCSSFSTFFWTDEELIAESKKKEITADAITKDHPRVREWIDTITYAVIECGINLIDTSPFYGHGVSETVLGYAIEELLSTTTCYSNESNSPNINRGSLIIQTKVGRYEANPNEQFDFTYAATISSVQRSLRRLSKYCEYIDVLQLHDPEFAPSIEILMKETIPAMIECRSKGWCKSLGITGYPLQVQYQIFQRTLELTDGQNVWEQSLTYGHFNLHTSSLVNERIGNSYDSYASFCRDNGLTLLAAAPLSMGLLTQQKPPDWHPANGTDLALACTQAAEICSQNGVDIVSLALLFAFSYPLIPCTILGMKNIEEVKKAADIAKRFDAIDWASTDKGTNKLQQDDMLQLVLSDSERRVYKILKDTESGPFSRLWREDDNSKENKNKCVKKYEWDGIAEARKFWIDNNIEYTVWQQSEW